MAKLQVLRKQKMFFQQQFYFDKYGLKPGALVRHEGKVFRVETVGLRWFPDLPWLKGHYQNKDGSFSKLQRTVYGKWELYGS